MTIGELPRFAERIMASVEKATRPLPDGGKRPKAEVTKSSARTNLAHFGSWLVANGYLEENPFAADEAAAAERAVARRSARRQRALQRAQSPTTDHDDGDSDAGIGITDVPALAVVNALSRAIVRRATRAHHLRKMSGRGSLGGAPPLTEEVARQVAQSVVLRACTGVRTCETLALHTSRISDDGFEIVIDRQLDRNTPWRSDTPIAQLLIAPKYDKDPPRKAMVWPQFVPQLLAMAEAADRDHDGWLFPRTRSQVWWVAAYETLIAGGIELMNAEHAAGLCDDETHESIPAWTWKPHFLRHCYGSYSISPEAHGGLGWPLGLVSESMGHSSTRTTESIYLHPTRSERESIRASIARVVGL